MTGITSPDGTVGNVRRQSCVDQIIDGNNLQKGHIIEGRVSYNLNFK